MYFRPFRDATRSTMCRVESCLEKWMAVHSVPNSALNLSSILPCLLKQGHSHTSRHLFPSSSDFSPYIARASVAEATMSVQSTCFGTSFALQGTKINAPTTSTTCSRTFVWAKRQLSSQPTISRSNPTIRESLRSRYPWFSVTRVSLFLVHIPRLRFAPL